MRIFPAFAAAAFLAATPCMAQIVITPGYNDAARHEDRAIQQNQDARADEAQAHRDAAVGNYRGAAMAQDDAEHHEAIAQHQERRAQQDSQGGVRVEIGR